MTISEVAEFLYDDLHVYLDGPDDPEAYFAKITDADELRKDFREFLDVTIYEKDNKQHD